MIAYFKTRFQMQQQSKQILEHLLFVSQKKKEAKKIMLETKKEWLKKRKLQKQKT